jgi:hypothetical protein
MHSEIGVRMRCAIRYFRQGRREDAGLIIVTKVDLAAYKARLEAAGYVVLDNPDSIPPEISLAKSL